MSICSGCHGGCCRAFAVPTSGADILRLERELGLTFWDLIVRWADHQGQIARNYAPQFFFEDDPETPYVLCLKQSASQLFPTKQKCQFLVESPPDAEHPLGTASCGVYEQRPLSCRVFPLKLDPSSMLAVLHEVPAHGRLTDRHPAYSLCSRPWEASDVDPLQSVQDLVLAQFEMTFFKQLALGWNQNPGAWENFPDFLHTVYSQRVVPAPAREMPVTRAA